MKGVFVLLCCSQIGSTILAQAAGVPTLAWSGSGVAVSFAECHGDIPTDIYNKVRTVLRLKSSTHSHHC